MKHAFIPNVPPHVQQAIVSSVNRVGDDQWTVHQNMVIEYPDDRNWDEVEEVIEDWIESDDPDPEDDLMSFSLFHLLHHVEEHDEAYLLGCNSHREDE